MSKQNIIETIKTKFQSAYIDSHSFRGDDTVIVKKNDILPVCEFLKNNESMLFNFMMDVTAVDNMGNDPRFEVVYHFYSLRYNRRLRLKAPVTESDCEIDSVVSLWIGADWFEREVFDMYGIIFKGHPNLKRILLYEGFEGYPLRKDYPLAKRQPLIGPEN